jgi:arylsulfatase A-like enzyme
VILIVLDTVRAQSLSLYGYGRDTTPNLTRIAARGIRFDRAFSTAPWTAPSHASMFTGKLPHEMTVNWNRPLDQSSPTLAGTLAARGYATAGFVANTTYCSYETGLDRGFAHYEDYDVSLAEILSCSAIVQRTLNFAHHHPVLARRLGLGELAGSRRKCAARINHDFLSWLDRNSGRPYFAFLNYFDAHHPFVPPLAESQALPPLGRTPATPGEMRLLRDWWERDKRNLDPRDLELVRDCYDQCIASLDLHVGRLFDELERRDLLRETIVVITSDHGEHLGEHGLFGHGCSLYLPEIHVPLIVVAPGIAPEGRVVKEPVSLRDIPGTVDDLLGPQGTGTGVFPGRSLAVTWSGAAVAAVPVVSEIDAPPEADPNHGRSPSSRGPMTSLIDGHKHVIKNGDGREERYDLDEDADEAHDLNSKRDVRKKGAERVSRE